MINFHSTFTGVFTYANEIVKYQKQYNVERFSRNDEKLSK